MPHTDMVRHTLVLFPGALGDFLCLWHGLHAFRRRLGAPPTIVLDPGLFALVPSTDFTCVSIHRREIADLFGSDPLTDQTRRLLFGYEQVHSWTGYGTAAFAERLATATGAVVSIHPFRGMRPGEHAVQYFARCLGATPVYQQLTPPPAALDWAERLWSRFELGARTLIIHPGSGSQRKNWEGMREVAEMWQGDCRRRVLVLAGPAEERSRLGVPHDVCVHNEALDRVASVLLRAYRYLGNDSGVSHLAGLVGARGVLVFGPSDPTTWRPLSETLEVLRAPGPCTACGPERFCTHRLTVDAVYRALLTP